MASRTNKALKQLAENHANTVRDYFVQYLGFDDTKTQRIGRVNLSRGNKRFKLQYRPLAPGFCPVGESRSVSNDYGGKTRITNKPFATDKLIKHLAGFGNQSKSGYITRFWSGDNLMDHIKMARHLEVLASPLRPGYVVLDTDNHKGAFPDQALDYAIRVAKHILETYSAMPLFCEWNIENGGCHLYYNNLDLYRDIVNRRARLPKDDECGLDFIYGDKIVRLPLSHKYQAFIFDGSAAIRRVENGIEYIVEQVSHGCLVPPDEDAQGAMWTMLMAEEDCRRMESDAPFVPTFIRAKRGSLNDRHAYTVGERCETLPGLANWCIRRGYSFEDFKQYARKADRGCREYATASEEYIDTNLLSFWTSAQQYYNYEKYPLLTGYKPLQSSDTFISSIPRATAEDRHTARRLARQLTLNPECRKYFPKAYKAGQITEVLYKLLCEMLGRHNYDQITPRTLNAGLEIEEGVRERLLTGFRVGKAWQRGVAKSIGFSYRRMWNLYSWLIEDSGIFKVLKIKGEATYFFKDGVYAPRGIIFSRQVLDIALKLMRDASSRIVNRFYTPYIIYIGTLWIRNLCRSSLHSLGRAPPAWQTG